MAPRLTRKSAGNREGTEQTEINDDRHEEASDDDQDETFFGEEGGDGDGEGGSDSPDPDSEQEDDMAEKPKPKKRVAINDTKPVDKRKPIDPVIKESARAAVRFDEDRYNALCPDEERSRGKSTLLRKRSLYHTYHQLKSPDGALADVVAKNPDDEDPELSFTLFAEYITQIVEDPKTFDVRLTRKDLTLDLKQKMEEFAELFIRNSAPCVPFQSLLPSSDIPVSDYLNEETFTELCDEDPQAMFQEFKLLSIMSMARAEQVSELHRLVSLLNVKLKTIHDWVPALADEYDQEKSGPNTNPAMVQQLKDSLVEKDDIIEGLKDLIADLSIGKGVTRNEKKGKPKETVLPSVERDASEVPLRASIRFSTLPTEINPDNEERSSPHHRTIKQADPAKYYNQNKEDDVPFEAWYDLIQDKLEVNADHYPTDRDKFLYVKSRLAGYAYRDLMPYLRETHPDQIKTYSGLMTHLWRQYHDPNQEENALQNFTKLQMKGNDNFDFFKNKFVRMAGECQRPKTEWKRELFQRLPIEYKKQMGAKHRDSSISFESYCNDCSGFGQVLKIIAEENKAASKSGKGNKGEGNRNPSSKSSSAFKPAMTSSGGGSAHQTSDLHKETTRLFNEGRCFLCKKRGHTKRDCPEKERFDRERRDRVAAIVDRHLAHDDRREPSVGPIRAPATNEQGN